MADILGRPERELEEVFETARRKLFDVRRKRVHPHKDDKILTDWNGMMIAALALSACGAQPAPAVVEAPAATEAPVVTEAPSALYESSLPEIDPADFSGSVVTAGSSTVFPLAEVMAERFKDEGFAGEVTIDSIGSGAGFERFCKTGETDVANASRGIKDSEIESCAAIGRTPIEFRVGTDALAIVVSSENDFLTDVTLEELAMIFSSNITKWSDVRTEWPNEDILRFMTVRVDELEEGPSAMMRKADRDRERDDRAAFWCLVGDR